jgi:RNA polymerase sigma-70 factor (ECF subfamily)
MARARQGSEEALGQILDACRPYLLLVANEEVPVELRGKLGPSDVVQDTLLRAFQEYAAFRGSSEGELRAWLRRILFSKIADCKRQFIQTDKRAVHREADLAGWELAQGPVSPEDSPSAS